MDKAKRVIDDCCGSLPIEEAVAVIEDTPYRLMARYGTELRVYLLLAEDEYDNDGIFHPRLIRDERRLIRTVFQDYHADEMALYNGLCTNTIPRHHPILDLFAQTDQLHPKHRVVTVLLYPWQHYDYRDGRDARVKACVPLITMEHHRRLYPPVSTQMVLRYIEYLRSDKGYYIIGMEESQRRNIARVLRWWRRRLI
jgi:hypothetical protein